MGPLRLEEKDDCIGASAGASRASGMVLAYWQQLVGGGGNRQQ